jgi:2C-methyl-D-erythritol 2,4-cyclodiphosphate synthase
VLIIRYHNAHTRQRLGLIKAKEDATAVREEEDIGTAAVFAGAQDRDQWRDLDDHEMILETSDLSDKNVHAIVRLNLSVEAEDPLHPAKESAVEATVTSIAKLEVMKVRVVYM